MDDVSGAGVIGCAVSMIVGQKMFELGGTSSNSMSLRHCEVLNGTVGGPRQQTTGRGPGREDKQQKLLRYTVRSKPLSALRFPASVINVTKHGARAYPLRATPTTANSAHRSR